MKIRSLFALLVPALLLVAGCASIKVSSEVDPQYDFSSAKTYRWTMPPSNTVAYVNLYLERIIHEEIDRALAARGLTMRDDKKTDWIVTAWLQLHEQQEYADTSDAEPDQPILAGGLTRAADGGWTYAERGPDVNAYIVELGTLTVLVFDGKTGRCVWRGTAKTKIDRSRSDEERRKIIREAVDRLMARFPRPPVR